MGKLDQFIKRLFTEETPRATHDALSFSVPPQTPTPAIEADGVLLLKNPAPLALLPYPWRLATREEVVLELKMQGDHIDREELELALLRRQAWQRKRAKERPKDPTQIPVWVVSAYLPTWIQQERLLERAALACYRLEPAFYEVYWIAANELPLKEDLLPFLVTRTGRALVELVKWVIDTRPQLGEELLEVVPMTETQFEEVVQGLKEPDEAERLRRRRRLAEALAEGTGLRDELLRQGEERALLHLIERRLGRALSDEEMLAFTQKSAQVSADRISDVLLTKTPEALLAWLTDPKAT